jgi:hypothetical protein
MENAAILRTDPAEAALEPGGSAERVDQDPDLGGVPRIRYRQRSCPARTRRARAFSTPPATTTSATRQSGCTAGSSDTPKRPDLTLPTKCSQALRSSAPCSPIPRSLLAPSWRSPACTADWPATTPGAHFHLTIAALFAGRPGEAAAAAADCADNATPYEKRDFARRLADLTAQHPDLAPHLGDGQGGQLAPPQPAVGRRLGHQLIPVPVPARAQGTAEPGHVGAGKDLGCGMPITLFLHRCRREG